MSSNWQKKAIEIIQRPVPWLSFLSDEPAAQLMTRTEIISRRYEAMRMKWPDIKFALFTREALCLAWPKVHRLK